MSCVHFQREPRLCSPLADGESIGLSGDSVNILSLGPERESGPSSTRLPIVNYQNFSLSLITNSCKLIIKGQHLFDSQPLVEFPQLGVFLTQKSEFSTQNLAQNFQVFQLFNLAFFFE